MTFNPNIPAASNALSTSQAQILTNFSQTNTIFDANHITFNNASVPSRGKHRKVDLIIEPTAGGPATIASELVLYQKTSGGSSNLFFKRDGVATEIQLTGAIPIAAATGCTFLAGGLKINWGVVTVPAANGSVTAPFNQAFTGLPFSVVATAINGSSPVTAIATVSAVANNQCTIHSRENNNVYYMAIGLI